LSLGRYVGGHRADLSNTPVTDARLNELAGLKQLRTLHLSGTKVTRTGVFELQSALPDCE
jgi:hypothetical protein